MQVFPQQITSCLMARVQTRAGFHGASCGRTMHTTPQREPKNTMRAQCTHKLPNTAWLQRRKWELVTACCACLPAKEQVMWTCKHWNLMCLPSFTTQTLWVGYFTNRYFCLTLCNPASFPLLPHPPLPHPAASHFSRSSVTTLSQIWQPSLRSLSLVLLPSWDSPPRPLVLLHPLLSIPDLCAFPQAQPLLSMGRAYLTSWLLLYVSRPTLLNPGSYWTSPLNHCHLEFNVSKTRHINHFSPHLMSTFLSMVPL